MSSRSVTGTRSTRLAILIGLDWSIPRERQQFESRARGLSYGKSTGRSGQFDLDEAKLIRVGIDDVVGNARRARIGSAGLEMHLPGTRRLFLCEPQCATSHRHNDIVVGVDVVSGIGTRREAPLRNRYTVIFDLYFGRRFHNAYSPPKQRRVKTQPHARSPQDCAPRPLRSSPMTTH